MPQSENSRQIAALNDAFRTSFNSGTLMLTAGIQALPEEVQVEILYKVTSRRITTRMVSMTLVR